MNPLPRILPILGLCLVSIPVAASISVEFQLGAIDAPPGSLGVLVADVANDGFQPPASVTGVPLVAGSVFGVDDVVIEVFSHVDLPEWSAGRGFSSHFAEIDYEALGVAEGQSIVLYVFPERAPGDPVRTGEPHVAYRAGDLTPLTANSTMGFELPADGGAYLLAVLENSAGGSADLSTVDIAAADLGDGDGELSDTLGSTGRHTYYFEMTEDGFLSINGTGSPGFRAELYHRDGELVASSDGDIPFFFEEDLKAGFHTLVVFRDDGGSFDQPYEIEFASEYVRFVRPDIAIGSKYGNRRGVGQYFAPGADFPLISRKAKRVNGLATVANLGARPEALAVRASKGTRLFRVRYQGPQGNITGSLTAGTYRTPVLDATSSPVVVRAGFIPNRKQLLVKRGAKTSVKRKVYSGLFYANSTSDTSLYDGAWWRLKTR